MKKSLPIFFSACLALTAIAAEPEQVAVSGLPSITNVSPTDIKPLGSLTVGRGAALQKAPARLNSVDDVIVVPEGTREEMTITASGYYLFFGIMLQSYSGDILPTNVVYGENNDVYIHNILPHLDYTEIDSYTKGTVNGNEVTIELPQTLSYGTEEGKDFNLTMLTLTEIPKLDENGEQVFDEEGNPVVEYTYAEKDEPSAITFKIGDDGVWTTTDLSEENMVGLTYNTGEWAGEWAGYGAIELSLTPFTDKPIEIPEGIEVSQNFWSLIDGDYGWSLNFAQGGDEIYFQGMCTHFPESWVKATVEYGDTEAIVRIPQGQYIGVYSPLYIYTRCARYDGESWWLMPEDYQYELIWNLEDNIMKSKEEDIYLIFNAAEDHIYSLSKFHDITLLHQDSFSGIPANPTNLTYTDMTGSGIFQFNVPGLSTEGTLLVTDNLYYVVYVDDEEWTFDAEEYAIPETLTEIPWAFSEFHIFAYNGTARLIDFFVEGITTLGVQSIYNYNGVETRSDIVTLDLDDAGVRIIGSDKEVAKVVYFDLSGRVINNPTDGLYIKRITYTDGTTISEKSFIR